MIRSGKIPLLFLIIGICWALFSNPMITLFCRHLAQTEQDSYRSLNDLIFVIIISYVLYVRIKKQQRQLAKSEEEYRQLFESNPNPLWISNERQHFVKVNSAAVQKYGHTCKRFLKMSVNDIHSTVKDDEIAGYLDKDNRTAGLSGIWAHVKASGETFFVSMVSYPVLFNDERCQLVMATDITELIEKEYKLKSAYEKLKTYNDVLLQLAWSNSHELRRPVASIMGLISLLKDAGLNEKDEVLRMLEAASLELDEVLKQNNIRVTEIEAVEEISLKEVRSAS